MSRWELIAWSWLAAGGVAAVAFTAYRCWECRSNRMPWEWVSYLGRVLLLLVFWPLALLAFLALLPSWLRQRRDRP